MLRVTTFKIRFQIHTQFNFKHLKNCSLGSKMESMKKELSVQWVEAFRVSVVILTPVLKPHHRERRRKVAFQHLASSSSKIFFTLELYWKTSTGHCSHLVFNSQERVFWPWRLSVVYLLSVGVWQPCKIIQVPSLMPVLVIRIAIGPALGPERWACFP